MSFKTDAVTISGNIVTGPASIGVTGARVTLFSTDLRFFREPRSDTKGDFRFNLIGGGEYRLGVAAIGFEYEELAQYKFLEPIAGHERSPVVSGYRAIPG